MFNLKHISAPHNWFSKFAGNSGWMAIAQVALMLDVIVRSIIIVRILTLPEFGIYAVILAFVGLFAEVVNLNFGSIILAYGTRYQVEKKDEALRALIKFGYFLSLTVSVLAVAVMAALLFFSYDVFIKSPGLEGPILILGAIAALHALDSYNKAILRLLDKFKFSCLIDVLGTLLNIPFIIIFLNIVEPTPKNALYATSMCIAFLAFNSTLITVIILRRVLPGVRKASLKTLYVDIREMVKLAFANSIASSIRRFSRKADVLILGAFHPGAAVGLYDVGKKLAALVLFARTPIAIASFPQITKALAQGQNRRLKALIMTLMKWAIPLIALAITILHFVAPYLITIIYGKEYVASAPILSLLAITSALYLLFFWANAVLLGKGKATSIMSVNFIGLSALAISGYFLVPNHQAMGMAVSAVIGTTVQFMAMSYATHRALKDETPLSRSQKPPEAAL